MHLDIRVVEVDAACHWEQRGPEISFDIARTERDFGAVSHSASPHRERSISDQVGKVLDAASDDFVQIADKMPPRRGSGLDAHDAGEKLGGQRLGGFDPNAIVTADDVRVELVLAQGILEVAGQARGEPAACLAGLDRDIPPEADEDEIGFGRRRRWS